MKGTVTFFSDYRGYGFVQGSDKREYFIHVSQIKSDGQKTLTEGQDVSFTPKETKKGSQAIDLYITETEIKPSRPISISLKRNPFTPQDPVVHAQKFSGRFDSIANAIDALFNHKNILIIGPRGIGKTSLSYQLMYMAQGKKDLLQKFKIDLGGYEFDKLSGDHRCVPGNDLSDICNGLLGTLCASSNEQLQEKSKKVAFGVDIKLFKYSTETTTTTPSPTDISFAFVSEVESIIKRMPHLRKSIVFVIDEVDVLDNDIEIAPFLRATSEKFRLNNNVDVSFIVSGITGTITDLISQHPSVSRLFENISLPRMEKIELEEIIDSCLDGTGVAIDQQAKDDIVKLSNQFPQPVHLLGYHSYKIDSNNVIEIDDVNAAKSFIVSDIKRQDFESKFDGINAGAMTEVIRAMAQAPLETINFNFMRPRLRHMSDDKILGTIGGLREKGIIEKQHRDTYRFCDPLFKIYLRWLFGIE